MFPDNTINDIIANYNTQRQNFSPEIKQTLKIDYQKLSVSIKDGSPLTIEQLEAIKQWVVLFIITPKDLYSIYDGTNFGTSLYKLRGEKKLINNGYIEAETERELKEGLPMCPAITRVTDFDLNKSGKYLKIYVQVQLYDGSLVDITVDDSYQIRGLY